NQEILSEARECFRMHGFASPLHAAAKPHTALSLLTRTIEIRARQSLERAFRLLGLRYPPNEIYNAYVAVESGKSDRATPAQDYLDILLAPDLIRLVLPLNDSRNRLTT